jgi:hypothetical protein
MVLLTTFLFPAEAWPLITLLREEGIPAFVPDQHVALANPLASQAHGPVRIMVPESCLEMAREILERFEDRRGEPAAESLIPGDDYYPVQKWCPRCEAFPVYRKSFSAGKTALAVALTLISYPFIFLFLPRKLRCSRCGYEWKV